MIRFCVDETGSTFAEYALILSLIVITAVAVLISLKESICTIIINAADTLSAG